MMMVTITVDNSTTYVLFHDAFEFNRFGSLLNLSYLLRHR
jgi:hypothetical protein